MLISVKKDCFDVVFDVNNPLVWISERQRKCI